MYQKEGLDKTTHPGGHVTKSYTYREYLGSLALNVLIHHKTMFLLSAQDNRLFCNKVAIADKWLTSTATAANAIELQTSTKSADKDTQYPSNAFYLSFQWCTLLVS